MSYFHVRASEKAYEIIRNEAFRQHRPMKAILEEMAEQYVLKGRANKR